MGFQVDLIFSDSRVKDGKGWELMISAWSFDNPPFYLMVFGGEEHAPENWKQ